MKPCPFCGNRLVICPLCHMRAGVAKGRWSDWPKGRPHARWQTWPDLPQALRPSWRATVQRINDRASWWLPGWHASESGDAA